MANLRRIRKMREEEVDHEGTWAVSYGDMVTLLLSFFILFFSIDPFHSKTPPTSGNPLVLSISDKKKSVVENGNEFSGKNTTVSEDLLQIVKKLNGVAVPLGNKLVIDFPGVSFFRSAEIPLTSRGVELLKQFAAAYEPYMANYKLNVMAYADTKKIKQNRGLRFSDNMELSALRGVASVRVLQAGGIPLKLMKTAGFGEIQLTLEQLSKVPKANLSNDEKLSLARRVILVVEPEENW